MAGSNPVIAITSENEFDTWIEKSQDILLGEFDRECRALCYSSKVCFASPVYVLFFAFFSRRDGTSRCPLPLTSRWGPSRKKQKKNICASASVTCGACNGLRFLVMLCDHEDLVLLLYF